QTEKLGINPHLCYDPDTFTALAAKLKDVFSKQDSVDNRLFEKNLENFNHKYQKVYDLVKQIKKSSSGTPVTATEPLFGYMANALGL
ncbi:ABC transporter substrate-binding protein, partial [Francisella tularensis subsp. holarctica]|uniref:metal ABC transporter solute-binding protein, Zn/Mn family n=1 Tax=Francisella tularensis TaxID=263 RepID=UPI0023ACB311|nr:ABC transporter substrate-binding protein [Francisella tularensis subsp. holarctica]